MSNLCGIDSSSPSCTCQDYYGNILPEYKYYNNGLQTYSCCFGNIVNFRPDTTQDNPIVNYYKTINTDTACKEFLKDIIEDTELKIKLPLLYWQTSLNKSLFNLFYSEAHFDKESIICKTGTPYIVSYPSYFNGKRNYKFLCGTSNIQSLQNIKFEDDTDAGEIDYRINYVKTNDGTDCITDSGCKLKYPTKMEYNIGSVAYESDANILEGPAIFSVWFWVVALVITLVISFVTYYLYYHHMEGYFNDGIRYLNKTSNGLGGTAKTHSLKTKASVNHMAS